MIRAAVVVSGFRAHMKVRPTAVALAEAVSRTVLRPVACAVWLACVPLPAVAGVQNVPCERPFVFSKAAVNVVVLPYSVPPALRNSAGAGRKLSALVQLESLLAIAKFGSVGAVQLVGDPCTPEVVAAKLLQRRTGAAEPLAPGAGLVLVWGRVFQSGADLYLQTFLQFLRRDRMQPQAVPETLQVRVGDRVLSARFTDQAFACEPRRIAVSDLSEIDRQFARTTVLRAEPMESARGFLIPTDAPFSYWITDVRGAWMKIVASNGGPQGWILARADRPDWSLRAKMPELSFVEGVAGFLRYRVAQDSGSTSASQTMLDGAEQALRTYIREWQTSAIGLDPGGLGSTPMAVALPLQVQGAIALLRRASSVEALQDARQAFGRSAELLPYSADARNLEVLARIVLAYNRRQPGLDPKSASSALLEALGREPRNPRVLVNLRMVYELLLADLPRNARPSDWAPLAATDRAEIVRNLDAIRTLMSASAAPAAPR